MARRDVLALVAILLPAGCYRDANPARAPAPAPTPAPEAKTPEDKAPAPEGTGRLTRQRHCVAALPLSITGPGRPAGPKP